MPACARLCPLRTDANLAHPDAPIIVWRALAAETDGLILLTGGHEGTLMRLLLAGQRQAALETACRYRDAFGPERVYITVQHHRLLDTPVLLRHLNEIAQEAGLRCVATNGVQYATRADAPRYRYDLMPCSVSASPSTSPTPNVRATTRPISSLRVSWQHSLPTSPMDAPPYRLVVKSPPAATSRSSRAPALPRKCLCLPG